MDNEEKPQEGYIQKFVEPKGKRNSVIKVTWSTQFALLEKRTNINMLESTKDRDKKVHDWDTKPHWNVTETTKSKQMTRTKVPPNPKTVTREMDIYNKVVTYEAFEHLSVPESISSPTLASDLHRACNSIGEHIRSITNGTVQMKRMVL